MNKQLNKKQRGFNLCLDCKFALQFKQRFHMVLCADSINGIEWQKAVTECDLRVFTKNPPHREVTI